MTQPTKSELWKEIMPGLAVGLMCAAMFYFFDEPKSAKSSGAGTLDKYERAPQTLEPLGAAGKSRGNR